MKLIFDWSDTFYEEKGDWRGDAEIISIEISHRECCFASAVVTIFTKKEEILVNKKYAKIGIQINEGNPKIDLLFTGRLVSFPIGFGNSSMKLEFISEPHDYQEQLLKFANKNLEKYRLLDKHALLKIKSNFDELFFSSKDVNNPTIFLENDNDNFYWNMKNGKLSLSHINDCSNNIDVDSNSIIQNSLKVHLAREPYKSINVSLTATWIQSSDGYIDLYPAISKNFQNGIISSYTNIKYGIENLCKFPHRSGYRLLDCKVKEITPAQSTIYKFPLTSRSFTVNSNSKDCNIKFRRFYFDGTMLVHWNYRQKIVENVNVKIVNTKLNYGREKTLHFKLNAIQLPKQYPKWSLFDHYMIGDKVLNDGFIYECLEDHFSRNSFDKTKWKEFKKIPDTMWNQSKSSFFESNRGKNAIRYAIQRATALINCSSRYVEISFCVDAKEFLHISLDDAMRITDPRFPNGQITGKVIRTKFIANANHRIICITIACCRDYREPPIEELNKYFDELLIDEEKKIKPQNIITEIRVTNLPEEQEKFLSNCNAETIHELESALKKHKTKIKLRLRPLNTTRVVTKDINLPDFRI
jgi:hypothetical protein